MLLYTKLSINILVCLVEVGKNGSPGSVAALPHFDLYYLLYTTNQMDYPIYQKPIIFVDSHYSILACILCDGQDNFKIVILNILINIIIRDVLILE